MCTTGSAEHLFCDAIAFQSPSLLLLLDLLLFLFAHPNWSTGIGKWFHLRCFSLSKILRDYVVFLFLFLCFLFLTGEDQANSANSYGEGTQGAANFGGTKSDPTAPLIKQNIPG